MLERLQTGWLEKQEWQNGSQLRTGKIFNEMKIRDLKPQDKDMVDGIVDIIKQVKDDENRKEIATKMVKQLKRERIVFNYQDFLKATK